jgi:hypothetical protein
MKNFIKMQLFSLILIAFMFLAVGSLSSSGVLGQAATPSPTSVTGTPGAGTMVSQTVSIDTGLPTINLADILTFAIRIFFTIAGIAALFYMLLGAFAWIQSGGEEEAVTGARSKITAAVLGMILIVGILAVIWTLEQIIFGQRICLGISCPLTIPNLVSPTAP